MQGMIAAAVLRRLRCCLHRQSGVPGASFHGSFCQRSTTTTARLLRDRQSSKSRARTILLGGLSGLLSCTSHWQPMHCLVSSLAFCLYLSLALGNVIHICAVSIPARIIDIQ